MTRGSSRLGNGATTADVEFRTRAESGFEPLNPEIVGVHAAFAKVLQLSGTAEYYERVEGNAESDFSLTLDKNMDYPWLLAHKLTVPQ